MSHNAQGYSQQRNSKQIRYAFLLVLGVFATFILFHPLFVFQSGFSLKQGESPGIRSESPQGIVVDLEVHHGDLRPSGKQNDSGSIIETSIRDKSRDAHIFSKTRMKKKGLTLRELKKEKAHPKDKETIQLTEYVSLNSNYRDWKDLYLIQFQKPIEEKELNGLSKLTPKSGSCVLDCGTKMAVSIFLTLKRQQKRKLSNQGPDGRYAIMCHFKRRGSSNRTSLAGWVSADGWFECPSPPQVDCTGHSTNRWDIKLNLTGSHTSFHIYYPARTEQRPFHVSSIHWYTPLDSIKSPRKTIMSGDNDEIQHIPVYADKLLQVVSFFLPSEIHGNECNILWCRLKSPSGIIYTSKSLLGDVSFAFCSIPSLVEIDSIDKWYVSLAYHHRFVTPWAPIVAAAMVPVRKKATMTICAIVKNEGHYLHEWIEYHRIVGVDQFILYDNNFAMNGTFMADHVMEKVIKIYKEEIIRVPWIHRHSQTEALTDCIVRFGNSTKWMGFIDVDEFFVPILGGIENSLKNVLEQYDSIPTTLNADWFVFGPCGQSSPPVASLTMEYCNNTQKNPEMIHKPIFFSKASVGVRAFGPHYVRSKSDVGKKGHSPSKNISKDLRVYHYRYRSWPEFREKRVGDTAGRILHRSSKDVQEMWEEGLKGPIPVEPHQNHILRYGPELRRRLEQVGWIR